MTFDEAVQLIRARCGDEAGAEAFELVVERFLRQLEGTSNNLGLADYLRNVKVGDRAFRFLAFSHMLATHINIEPRHREAGGWSIIGFHPASRQRLCWTHRGVWVFERDQQGEDAVFETAELEDAVQLAFDNEPAKTVRFPPRRDGRPSHSV